MGMALIFSCNTKKGYAPDRELVKFNRAGWDDLVKQGKVIYQLEKRNDGTLDLEKYFFGDTLSYIVRYDQNSAVHSITQRNAQQMEEWIDFYYSNGVRKGHYLLLANPMTAYLYHGYFEEYYENGKLQKAGLYKNGVLMWEAPFEKNGAPLDTIVYN